ncbi:hypothetical protein L596_004556 [Steinernema carpocapsae]|uniref:Uncharacterized protein n=1 Tax=Steinernema carpocapsae TaxID=34508 RepID=A0A4U8UWC1_STECR|nr:hypothetical protein L596_004556 [Steinernema carpocapsae]
MPLLENSEAIRPSCNLDAWTSGNRMTILSGSLLTGSPGSPYGHFPFLNAYHASRRLQILIFIYAGIGQKL